MVMILPFQHISHIYDRSKLDRIEHELTWDDIDKMTKSDWKYYQDDDNTTYLLPQLGIPFVLNSLTDAIVCIFGRNYQISISDYGTGEQYEPDGKFLCLEETSKPPSKPNKYGDYHFFSQPQWIQNTWFPADSSGNPCYPFLTVENGWGDSGNWNILLGIKNGVPNEVYFEASCY